MSELFQNRLPRPSLKDATPDHELAAALLSAAADAYLGGDVDLARHNLSAADIPALYRFGRLLMDRKDPDVAWPRKGWVARGDTIRAKLRMPSPAETLSIYARDGWRCRYCGCRVIYARARDILRKAFPHEVPWPRTGPMHGGFFALTASADHVVPYSKGGDNVPENLVTACWPCNFGMEGDTLEELGLCDPRLRPPVVDSWDGLTRLLTHTVKPSNPPNTPIQPAPIPPGTSMPHAMQENAIIQSAWYIRLDAESRRSADAFLTFLPTLADFGVTWSANEVLIVRMQVGNFTVLFFGVQPDLNVQVPWSTNAPKPNLREFAEYLAAGIPGAVVHETAKLWNVCLPPDKTVSLASLLNHSDEVRKAVEVLHSRMIRPIVQN